jgi:hypothetical protein
MKSLWGPCAAALTMMLLSQSVASAQSPKSLSLVLVVGEMTGPPVSDDVPMSARKALDELRGFLPFKSYRLYDTGVIGMPSETLPAVVRLRGATLTGKESQLVEVQVMRPKFSQSLDVALREVGQTDTSKSETGAAALPVGSLMAASVRVNAGETVVVGASRVRGDKALVLLITGMASSPGSPASDYTRTRTPTPAPLSPRAPQPAQPPQPSAQPGQPSAQPPQPAQPTRQLQLAPSPSPAPRIPRPLSVFTEEPQPAAPTTVTPVTPVTPAPSVEVVPPAPAPSRSPR